MAARRLTDTYGGYRARLLEVLRRHGIDDIAVLRAFGETPRHLFVPEALRHRAYDDVALPIGDGQTISQPTTQARALQALALTGRERVLEIGTGSGYQAALLTHLADVVFSIERVAALAARARAALAQARIRNVAVVVGDGTLGWAPQAPYDAIVIAAATPEIPAPLVEQLADGGRLVAPIGAGERQTLVRLTRDGDTVSREALGDVQFVPLVGRHGFPEALR